MCGRGRAGARQERTAQYGGRMFVFATTQGVQGDMPSAIARGLGENPKSTVAPCSRRTNTYKIASHPRWLVARVASSPETKIENAD